MAQNAANTGATLNGLFKQVYSKDVASLIPEFAILQKKIPFSKAKLLGDKYHQPVVLSEENGFTYGGSTASNYALNSAISMTLQDAQIPGSELTLQSALTYGAVSRAQSAGPEAVESAVKLLVERMKASAAKRVEIELIYGGSGLGKLLSGTGSSTTRVYTLTAASWAPGIWAGLENASLDVYNGSSQLNTNAAVVITAVNVGNKTLSVSGNASDLTAIDGALASTPSLFFYGAKGNEMTGIDQIILNAGTLFNIDASVYNLWAGNTYDCLSAAVTMAKVLSAVSMAVARGLMEDVVMLCAADTWANLNANNAGQRIYDQSYSSKEGKTGVESIKYVGQNGVIEVITHPMVKAGEAFIFPVDAIQRVGSTDIAFRGEGVDGEIKYLFNNQSFNSWTCRAYTDQAVLITMPSHCVKMINIVATP